MKVIIAGGRFYNDYKRLKKVCDSILSTQTEVIIVSGKARGADKLGEKYAKEKGYHIEPFPANWDKFGNSAGYIRNAEMAKYADALIAFWDGESRGTKSMIDLAKKGGLKIRIIKYNK